MWITLDDFENDSEATVAGTTDIMWLDWWRELSLL
jgi:hypothetical protein